MSENTRTSDRHTNKKTLSPKKQQKRYHKLEEDLADAQEALEEAQEDLQEAQERLQRSERRVQKRTARIQKIQQKILAARVSLGEDVSDDSELASWQEEDNDDTSSQTDEIPAITPPETTPAFSNDAPIATDEVPVAAMEETTETPTTTEEKITEEPVASTPIEEIPTTVVEESTESPVVSTLQEPLSPSIATEETVETSVASVSEEATLAPVAVVEGTTDVPITTVEQTSEEPVASTQEESPSATSASIEEVAIPASTVLDEENQGPAELVSESAIEEIAPQLDTTESSETPETTEISPAQEISARTDELSAPAASLDEQEFVPTPVATQTDPVTPARPSSHTYGLRAASAPAERQTDEIVAVRVPSSLRTPVTESVSTPASDDNAAEPSVSSGDATLADPDVSDQQDQPSSTFTAIAQAQEKVVATETQGVIDEANAVAEAAEEAADLAAERLFEFEQRLDRFVGGRHLEQDLAQLQAEVERTELFAFQARQAVTAVETQASLVEPAPSPFAQSQAELFDADSAPLEISVPPANDIPAEIAPSTSEDVFPTEKIAEIEKIDRQEEALEAAVSASITDNTQHESEHAEAYAEASGARAQEARALVDRVSKMVDMVVAAIDSGTLTGTSADEALAAAEQEMASAQAVLTALNIITERADSYSAEIEARAEVSGGMSYASEENWRKDTRLSNDLAEIEHEPAEIEHEPA